MADEPFVGPTIPLLTVADNVGAQVNEKFDEFLFGHLQTANGDDGAKRGAGLGTSSAGLGTSSWGHKRMSVDEMRGETRRRGGIYSVDGEGDVESFGT